MGSENWSESLPELSPDEVLEIDNNLRARTITESSWVIQRHGFHIPHDMHKSANNEPYCNRVEKFFQRETTLAYETELPIVLANKFPGAPEYLKTAPILVKDGDNEIQGEVNSLILLPNGSLVVASPPVVGFVNYGKYQVPIFDVYGGKLKDMHKFVLTVRFAKIRKEQIKASIIGI